MRTFAGLFAVAVMGHVVLSVLEDTLIKLLRWNRQRRRDAARRGEQ